MKISNVDENPPPQYCTVLSCATLLFVFLWASNPVVEAQAQIDDYEEWLKEHKETYETYLDEQDEAFLNFLEEQWVEKEMTPTRSGEVEEKPSIIPFVEGTPAEGTPAEGTPAEGTPKEGDNSEAKIETSTLTFLGSSSEVSYDASHQVHLEVPFDESSFPTFWEDMASTAYEQTVKSIQSARARLNLSDWGYYRYVQRAAAMRYDDTPSSLSHSAKLWTWFIMIQSGYDVRLGYRSTDIVLLVPAEEQVMGHAFLEIDGQHYYAIGDNSEAPLYTYQGNHTDAQQVIHFDERGSIPAVESNPGTRTVSFEYGGEAYNIEIVYESEMVQYLQSYPTVRIGPTFHRRLSGTAEEALHDALVPHLDSLDARDTLNFLLRFVQHATDYETDSEQFGETRYMFAEESLAASASDCDDRAALFARVVHSLLGYNVVGLLWKGTPGHVATAVQVNTNLTTYDHDRIYSINDTDYVLADPTYINGTLGMEMPFIENRAPELITTLK